MDLPLQFPPGRCSLGLHFSLSTRVPRTADCHRQCRALAASQPVVTLRHGLPCILLLGCQWLPRPRDARQDLLPRGLAFASPRSVGLPPRLSVLSLSIANSSQSLTRSVAWCLPSCSLFASFRPDIFVSCILWLLQSTRSLPSRLALITRALSSPLLSRVRRRLLSCLRSRRLHIS